MTAPTVPADRLLSWFETPMAKDWKGERTVINGVPIIYGDNPLNVGAWAYDSAMTVTEERDGHGYWYDDGVHA